ncbi:MAG: RIP metalloprotease RseP [Deltaproteobacteria bacterium]|nr:RIP metalloprotease RseP [Deltaproteobacteria bacterium]
MSYVLGICILFFAVVGIHEFGHFLVARLFGVRCDVFSIGFGPKIFKKKWGQTEYCVSAIPLGGYVKIHGQEQDEEIAKSDHEAFVNKPVGQRFLIAAAGPIFNFLFALVVLLLMALTTGEKVRAPIAERVLQGTQAALSGFQVGDEILKINGRQITRWDDVENVLDHNIGHSVSVELKRKTGEKLIINAPVWETQGLSIIGKYVKKGAIDGLYVSSLAAFVGIDDPKSLLAQTGLQTQDQILEVNSIPLQTWQEVEDVFFKTEERKIHLKVKRENNIIEANLTLPQNYFSLSLSEKRKILGLYSSALFIAEVPSQMPAEIAGLQKGDHIIAVGGIVIQSFEQSVDAIQSAMRKEGKISITYRRAGVEYQTEVVGVVDPNSSEDLTRWLIGVSYSNYQNIPQIIVWKTSNPLRAFSYAASQTGFWVWVTIKTMAQLVTGQVSTKNLGGPIRIGQMAGEMFERSFSDFLKIMAIISVNLGVLNFIPLPVFDGGHLMFCTIEAIRRKPLGERATQVANIAGIAFILVLIIYVCYNDLRAIFG